MSTAHTCRLMGGGLLVANQFCQRSELEGAKEGFDKPPE